MANPQTWKDPNTGEEYELVADTAPQQTSWKDPKTGEEYELVLDTPTPNPPKVEGPVNTPRIPKKPLSNIQEYEIGQVPQGKQAIDDDTTAVMKQIQNELFRIGTQTKEDPMAAVAGVRQKFPFDPRVKDEDIAHYINLYRQGQITPINWTAQRPKVDPNAETTLSAPPVLDYDERAIQRMSEMASAAGEGLNAAFMRMGGDLLMGDEQQKKAAQDILDERARREMFWEDQDRRSDSPVTNTIADFVGGAIGDVNPTYFVNPEIGLGATGRILSQGILGGGIDTAIQANEVASDMRDNIDPARVLQAAAANAAFAGAAEGLGAFGRRFGDEAVPEQAISAERPEVAPEVKPAAIPEQAVDESPLPFEQPDFLKQSAKRPRTKAAEKVEAPKVEQAAEAPKAPEGPKPRVTVDDAVNRINETVSDWKNGPKYNVAKNVDELPPEIRQSVIEDGAEDAAGFVHNGEVYVLSDNLRDLDHVAAVTYHEGLGHVGLERQFRQRLDAVMEQMYKTNQMVRESADAWLKHNTTQHPNPTAHAVEEVLAETSEGGKIEARLIEKIKAFLKQYARRIPGLADLKYTDKEVFAILSMAHQKTIDGKSAFGRSGNRYMRLRHASPHDFEQFDHSKMGTGEGAQSFGWGTYLAEGDGTINHYKETLSPVEFTLKDGTKAKMTPKNALDYLKSKETFSAQLNRLILETFHKMKNHGSSIDEAVEDIRRIGYKATPEKMDEVERLIKTHFTNAERVPANVYDVEVPDNAKWLDLDKPLTEQKDILELVKKDGLIEVMSDAEWQKRYNRALEKTWDDDTYEIGVREMDYLKDKVFKEGDTGVKLYHVINDYFLYDAKMTSEYLHDLGIAGNRYLDEGSRGKIEGGTSNYVVFNDKTPKIVNKYSREDGSGRERGLRRDSEQMKLTEKVTHNPSQAAKTFLRELGVFNNQELMRMSHAEAITRAERLGIDHDWIDYYNDAKWNPETKKVETPTPQPDMKRYIPEIKFSKPDEKAGRTRGLRIDKNIGKNQDFNSKFIRELEKDLPEKYRQSWEETEELASKIGMNVKKMEQLRKGPKAEEIEAGRMFTIGKLNLIHDLQKKMDEGTITPREMDQFIIHLKQFVDMFETMAEVMSTAGRNLNILKKMTVNNKAAVNNVRYALEQAEKHGLRDVESMNQISKALDELKKNPKINRHGYSKLATHVFDILNIPRTIMSSFDLSAPLRQGISLVHRKEWWGAFFKMFKYAFSEKAYKEMLAEIQSRPTFKAMEDAKLFIADIDNELNSREEAFMSKFAGKLPGIKLSERAYNGFLNKLRADTFDAIYQKSITAGLNLEKGSKELKDIAGFINNATGRGSIKHFDNSMPILTAIFFSPRLIASRIQLLNPAYYATLSPLVRKEALKSIMSLGVIAVTIGGLAKAAGMDVEVDPRSSDFMKLRAGNTRYDILGGFAQYITLGARLVTNEKKTTAGVIKQYGSKFGEENRLDVIEKFFENKFSPVASFVADYFRGKNAVGKEFKMSEAITTRLIPLYLQDAYEVSKDKDFATGALMATPGIFGVGTQTYSDERGGFEIKDRSTDDPGIQEIQRLGGDKDIVSTGAKDDAKSLGIPELDEKQLKSYRDYSSQLISAAVKEAMATPEWKEASDEEKVKWVKLIGKDMRLMAREDLFGSDNEEEEQPTDEYNDEE